LLLVFGLVCVSSSALADEDIRLVLQVTVDGLRADLLDRDAGSFGKGGFRRLLDNGIVYRDAHYLHANTETIVGHATLATGASPSLHGMVGNAWYDRDSGELAYNIEDADYPMLPTRDQASTGEQVDPAQKLARSSGRSPRTLLAPTLADSMAARYGGRAKLFAVSGKDRSAVAMAGHAGTAYWFSTDSGDFVTSSYYHDDYPPWVDEWNAMRLAEGYAGRAWELTDAPSSYRLIDRDDRPYEADLRGYGRVFPHPYGELDDKLLQTRLLVSPVGDRLLANFTQALVRAEGLGQDDVPDYLSVSFSSVDAVNHFFGPQSLENESVLRQLDRTLAGLLAFIDEAVGLDRTLVVLSADHGIAEMPEQMTELGYPARRHDPDAIVAAANAAGWELGIDGVVRAFFRPYLYLDTEKIAAAKRDLSEVRSSVAVAVERVEGIWLALPTHRLDGQRGGRLLDAVRHNHHPDRSGDIYVAQSPYWFLFSKGPVRAMHGSPWRYDTHVPIIFARPGVEPRRVDRRIHPVDVAPTVAALLGMSPPASAQGTVLEEVTRPVSEP
jgi:predicted AlkP superfamily pyrophosphatase or phosphodiesterase